MEGDQFAALVVFACVASFTPGPNNTIAFGVPVGFSSMLLAAAGGVAALLLASPSLATLLKWLGVAYLLWLSWQLARPAAAGNGAAGGPFALPLGFSQSALFQYLNPKAWMLALATATAFIAGDAPYRRAAIVVAVYALFTLTSLLAWGWLGARLRVWLAGGGRLRAFNLAMGALLAATALWMGAHG